MLATILIHGQYRTIVTGTPGIFDTIISEDIRHGTGGIIDAEHRIRERLTTLRDELEHMVASSKDASDVVELDQTRVGRLSRMDAMQAQAMASASAQRRAGMLQNIAAALKRLDDGEYGLCRRCEEPINPKRLEIDPTALYCIDCASQSE